MPPTGAAIAYSASYGTTSSRFGLLLEVEEIFSETLTLVAPIGAATVRERPSSNERFQLIGN
jgi:hypothetical protein